MYVYKNKETGLYLLLAASRFSEEYPDVAGWVIVETDELENATQFDYSYVCNLEETVQGFYADEWKWEEMCEL